MKHILNAYKLLDKLFIGFTIQCIVYIQNHFHSLSFSMSVYSFYKTVNCLAVRLKWRQIEEKEEEETKNEKQRRYCCLLPLRFNWVKWFRSSSSINSNEINQ